MITASAALCSVYPLLYYNRDNQGNSAVAAFIGGLFGAAKSIVVTFFVFVAAPLCAAVIGFVRENNGEIIDNEKILRWSQLTILRFTKGILTGICIIPLIIMDDIPSFLVATATSLAVGEILAEIGLRWWNVKHGVKELVVTEIVNKRLSRRSTATVAPTPQDIEMEEGAVEQVEMQEDGDEEIGLMVIREDLKEINEDEEEEDDDGDEEEEENDDDEEEKILEETENLSSQEELPMQEEKQQVEPSPPLQEKLSEDTKDNSENNCSPRSPRSPRTSLDLRRSLRPSHLARLSRQASRKSSQRSRISRLHRRSTLLRNTLKNSKRSNSEWNRRTALLREHSFSEQITTANSCLIIIISVTFPKALFLKGYKSDTVQTLFKGDIIGFIIRTLILVCCERFEDYRMKKRIKKVWPAFKQFRPVFITWQGYFQISLIPTFSFYVVILLFPNLWL